MQERSDVIINCTMNVMMGTRAALNARLHHGMGGPERETIREQSRSLS